jgi:hypothetical protein
MDQAVGGNKTDKVLARSATITQTGIRECECSLFSNADQRDKPLFLIVVRKRSTYRYETTGGPCDCVRNGMKDLKPRLL